MQIAHEMRRLRAEHAALATLFHFLMELVRQADPPRPTELAAVRGMLRDTLVRHLKCEDWALYPRLQASGDPELARMTRVFSSEMGHLAGDFAAYDARWTAERVAAEWSGFRRETAAILAALGERMAREEKELYPLAEEAAAPHPQRRAAAG
ncbi:MAG TPA: hemerythrin domain-containing protein [Sphingopyxis sp.]|nr:hemerythrin domain-containing protein [Sphingopyxis sp.]HMP43772.1 hemerythrin domain-containing protein [Sphingopyxis sp.]HMQ17527.1 hemerythrin domain-containing protein [Sphingopyxis sp.]